MSGHYKFRAVNMNFFILTNLIMMFLSVISYGVVIYVFTLLLPDNDALKLNIFNYVMWVPSYYVYGLFVFISSIGLYFTGKLLFNFSEDYKSVKDKKFYPLQIDRDGFKCHKAVLSNNNFNIQPNRPYKFLFVPWSEVENIEHIRSGDSGYFLRLKKSGRNIGIDIPLSYFSDRDKVISAFEECYGRKIQRAK